MTRAAKHPYQFTAGAETVAGDASSSDTPLPAVASKDAGTERHNIGDSEPLAVSVNKEGPWVINLVSSTSQADADRMAEKARSVGIETQQQQVMVKGTQYWRVQVTGFTSQQAGPCLWRHRQGQTGTEGRVDHGTLSELSPCSLPVSKSIFNSFTQSFMSKTNT